MATGSGETRGINKLILLENELLWPTLQMQHRLNDHPRYPGDAMYFMLFMGCAKRVRINMGSEPYFGKENPWINYFDQQEINSIYEDTALPLVEAMNCAGNEESCKWNNHFLHTEVANFITMYRYASRHRMPVVLDLHLIDDWLQAIRAGVFQGRFTVADPTLLSAFINLVACYSNVTPYCLRPAQQNAAAAQELISALFRQPRYMLISRMIRALGFPEGQDRTASLERTKALATRMLRSEVFSHSYELAKSFVSLWTGPASIKSVEALGKLVKILGVNRYIPPIYDIRQIHVEYDWYRYPGIEDYGGL